MSKKANSQDPVPDVDWAGRGIFKGIEKDRTIWRSMGILEKPVDIPRLFEMIRKVVDGREKS